jgi:hypothetical protein
MVSAIREWTRRACVDGGALFGKPQERSLTRWETTAKGSVMRNRVSGEEAKVTKVARMV